MEGNEKKETDYDDTVRSNVLKVTSMEAEAKENRTAGEKIAEYIAAFCGSMAFVYIHIVWFGVWILVNTATRYEFDPFPFTFLTLCVSLEAIFLSTFILISQNHETRLTERRNHLDLQINMLAEQESTKTLELVQLIAKKVGVKDDDPLCKDPPKTDGPRTTVERDPGALRPLMNHSSINNLKAFDSEGRVNVIIDTPKGSRNKYVFNKETGLFKLGGTLTAGHSFPYDFGFIPGTNAEDNDHVDVLVMMDEPAFVGCWIKCRIIGGYKAIQTERDGHSNRNDRLLAVEEKSMVYSEVHSLEDLDEDLVDAIEHFFVSYNEAKGKKFQVEERFDAGAAIDAIKEAEV